MGAKITFGEFLVESKAISEADLIHATIDQQNKTPTVLEIVKKHNWLDNSQIFEVLKLQNEIHCEFRTAAKKLNYWNTTWDTEIQAEMSLNQSGISEILLHQNKITPEQLTEAFDQYLGVMQSNESKPTIHSDSPILIELKQALTQIREIAKKSLQTGSIQTADNLTLLESLEIAFEVIGSLDEKLSPDAGSFLSQVRFHKKSGLKPRQDRLRQWLQYVMHFESTQLSSHRGQKLFA